FPPRPFTAWHLMHCSVSKIRDPRVESPGITGNLMASKMASRFTDIAYRFTCVSLLDGPHQSRQPRTDPQLLLLHGAGIDDKTNLKAIEPQIHRATHRRKIIHFGHSQHSGRSELMQDRSYTRRIPRSDEDDVAAVRTARIFQFPCDCRPRFHSPTTRGL